MILVTGATGNVGSHVVRDLLAAGEPVRALTRRADADLPSTDVEVHLGDIAAPDTLDRALRGVDRVFLFPVFGAVEGFLDFARRHGVGHVTLLSTQAVLLAEPGWVGEMHLECERALTRSGLSWTLLRPTMFMANDRDWLRQVAAGEVVRVPYKRAVMAPVDERDIAAVAARSLRDPRDGAAYELTGPQALSQAERVRVVGEVLGRPAQVEEVTREQARQAMVRHMPHQAADFALDQLAAAQEHPARVVPTVAQVTGRPAHTWAEWVAHRAARLSAGAGRPTAAGSE
ncbi:NAD(P)H-binding protein [Micromonospora sp. NPDC047670]|uniref:NAD(P)H-binding protein n=1 Tax=Micromonospora sp. NPDC047670 TaxID=3364252 RepID=UPI003723F84A